MLNRILGEKNSVKRMIMSFSLCLILITMVFGGMILFQSYMADRQYDEMLQNIVSIDRSKGLTGQLKLSAKKYAEARNERDYARFRTEWTELDQKLDVVEDISREPASLLAVRSIRQLLVETDTQVLRIRSGLSGNGTFAQVDERCNNVLYLLDRVQNLEVNHAAAVYPQLNRDFKLLTRLAGVILVLMLLAAITFSMDLHARIYAPIRQLVVGVGEISKGNFQDPDIEIAASDEFDYLATAVNGMKRDLSRLITTREEKMNAERLLKETQFLALQSQVNPHFLFNVLGTATAMALVEGADKTLGIVESISYMLRYSLQSMKTDVTLRDELKMVQTYLFLQNQRFGDRISFFVEMDDTIPDVPVPGMTVQPIVENAVIHGCENMESGGWLKVACKLDTEENCAVVTVENNGGVILQTQIQAFYSGQSVPHGRKTTGIGLGNVRDRLRHFYDREGLMDCAVTNEKINVVTLRYPMGGGET
ncbi:histidine kinase [uncultured Oscillibacter sp.]|uniref:sensor histidine kinase n=1 Tax=uncultured Oscillibacter sp. TaxID=876091 RepID=UPI0025E461C1|nr:histidine kinase [uncultured Oscillibacter sp.]